MTNTRLSLIQKCPQLHALKKAQENPQFDAMSEDSEAVVKNFGSEAPSLLNEYANHLEDTILQLIGDLKAMRQEFSLEYDVEEPTTTN